ncbi:PFL_4669 family integrating conjugative element protein [Achromobacter aloeverae]
MATRKPLRVDTSLNGFARSDRSSFPDKYDLDGERKILKELLTSDDPDPAHPLFARLQLFEERTQEFEQMQAEHVARAGADAIVPVGEARQIRHAAPLVADSQDVMQLHTAEAMRLFLGRAREPGTTDSPMAGGKRVAAAMRSLWALSSNDNPYADWSLMDLTERTASARTYVRQAQQEFIGKLDEMKARGFTYSILQAKEPMKFNLGFASPYGYMVAMLITDIDYLVRAIKSAQRRDLVSGKHAHQILMTAKHKTRSMFEKALFWQKYLMKEEMLSLTRLDFLPSADEDAQKRVIAVKALFGDVPKAIFMGEQQPRHTKRKVHLSAAELRLLDQVPLQERTPMEAVDQLLQDGD